MSVVYVRDVSPASLDILKQRASEEHESLQSYVRDLLEREAAMPTMREAMAHAAEIAALANEHDSIRTSDVLQAIDEGRARR